jgi:hypothetical protein
MAHSKKQRTCPLFFFVRVPFLSRHRGALVPVASKFSDSAAYRFFTRNAFQEFSYISGNVAPIRFALSMDACSLPGFRINEKERRTSKAWVVSGRGAHVSRTGTEHYADAVSPSLKAVHRKFF